MRTSMMALVAASAAILAGCSCEKSNPSAEPVSYEGRAKMEYKDRPANAADAQVSPTDIDELAPVGNKAKDKGSR